MAIWNKKTIGLSDDIDKKLSFISESLQFSDAQDAYKFCFSIEFVWAIEHGKEDSYSRDESQGNRITKWATGNFDHDQTFSSLAAASAPESFEGDFSKYVEVMADAGVERVHTLINTGEYLDISEIYDSVMLK